MALLGCYGPIIFECSRRKVCTFSDLKASQESRYAEHGVHNQLPILEWIGPSLSELSFQMNFNREWHVDPIAPLSLLRTFARHGMVAPLLVGHRPVVIGGMNMWVLTKLEEEQKWFMRNGTLFGASVTVNLKEYRILL